MPSNHKINIDGLMRDCSYSSALAMELLQFFTKLSVLLFGCKGDNGVLYQHAVT